jgi:hypothetical protein
MLPLAHTGLTPPAVAGPGCNEGLGLAGVYETVYIVYKTSLWRF